MRENETVSCYSFENVRSTLDNLGLQNVELRFFEEIDSTNTEMKKSCLLGDIKESLALFIAKRQTAGRGRLGKSFVSEDGGVYLSLYLPAYALRGAHELLTAYAAIVISDYLDGFCKINTEIKWVNDIHADGKKLLGILSEGVFCDTGAISGVIVGVGLNVFRTDFPKELGSIATSLEDIIGKKLSRADLACGIVKELLDNLPRLTSPTLIADYKEKSNVLGKEITVIRGAEIFDAVALNINEKAELIVSRGGELITLSSGEVSIKAKK